MSLRFLLLPDFHGWLVAGAVALAAGVWVLRTDARSRVNQYFGLWMLVMALTALLLRPLYWELGDSGRILALWGVTDTWLATAFATWAYAFFTASSGRRIPRWLPVPFLVVAAGTTIIAFLWPEAIYVTTLEAPHVAVGAPAAAVWFAEEIVELSAYGVVACAAMRRFLVTGATRPHLLLLAGGVTLWVVAHGAVWVVVFLGGSSALGIDLASMDALPMAYRLTLACIAVAMIVAAAITSSRARRRGSGHGAYLLLAITAAAAAGAIAFHAYVAGPAWAVAANGVVGALGLAGPVAAAFALVKEQTLGPGHRQAAEYRRVTVASAAVFAYFLASEATEGVISSTTGSALAGLAAAGAMALFASPLRRLADRLGKDDVVETIGPDETYRQQFLFAASDGALDERERQRLDHLGKALGLDKAACRTLEQSDRAIANA